MQQLQCRGNGHGLFRADRPGLAGNDGAHDVLFLIPKMSPGVAGDHAGRPAAGRTPGLGEAILPGAVAWQESRDASLSA